MIQQFLTCFTGTLNRRRAYAATHPMVRAAEEQLLDSVYAALAGRSTLSIGVARHELLIDGEPWKGRVAVASELATRLHKRGVGAMAFEDGVTLAALREALTWLASDPDGSAGAPPSDGGVHITHMRYDHLVLDDAVRDAEHAVASLWRALAEMAGMRPADVSPGSDPPAVAQTDDVYTDLDVILNPQRDTVAGLDTDAIVAALRAVIGQPVIARRTAVAVMELTNRVSGTSEEGRILIGTHLDSMMTRLGDDSLLPIMRSLADTAQQQRFAKQVVDALPLAAASRWLSTAATAAERPMSHQMLRLMTKLATLADERDDLPSEAAFRDATHELVNGWTLQDPNPAVHAELLDRIASCERTDSGSPGHNAITERSIVESSRLVQMALELDTTGEDSLAAVETLVAVGAGQQVMSWITQAGPTESARVVHLTATSERAVRQLLLTEPVDRLDARALLAMLDASSTDTLLDILAESTTRGTRLIVRQRLIEFGDVIVPEMLRRLDDAEWYVVRNILSILHELGPEDSASTEATDGMLRLLDHPKVQVRLEALRLLLLDPVVRHEAVRRALGDSTERVVAEAITAIADSAQSGQPVPEHHAVILRAMVDAGERSDSLRARSVRALASTRSDAMRDWLIGLATRRTRVLRRLKLVEPTQVAVSALQALMRMYRDDESIALIRTIAKRDGTGPRWTERESGATVEYAS